MKVTKGKYSPSNTLVPLVVLFIFTFVITGLHIIITGSFAIISWPLFISLLVLVLIIISTSGLHYLLTPNILFEIRDDGLLLFNLFHRPRGIYYLDIINLGKVEGENIFRHKAAHFVIKQKKAKTITLKYVDDIDQVDQIVRKQFADYINKHKQTYFTN